MSALTAALVVGIVAAVAFTNSILTAGDVLSYPSLSTPQKRGRAGYERRLTKPLVDAGAGAHRNVSFGHSAAVRFDINIDINCAGRPWTLVDD